MIHFVMRTHGYATCLRCVRCSFVFEFGLFCTSFARSLRSHAWAVRRTFSSPLAAFCQNPLNAEPTSGDIVIQGARLRDFPSRLATPPGQVVSGPNLCPGAKLLLAGGRPSYPPLSHPLIAAILLIAGRRTSERATPTVNQDSF